MVGVSSCCVAYVDVVPFAAAYVAAALLLFLCGVASVVASFVDA